MAYGFEVYAANGTKIIDLADRVSRSVTSGTTPTITSGSYYDGLLGYLKAWESVVPLITSLLGQANGLRNTNL